MINTSSEKQNTDSKEATKRKFPGRKQKSNRKSYYEERSNSDEELQYWKEGEYDDDVLLLHDA